MIQSEPPPIAVWILEHMTSGDRDEALAGDLLEAHQSGRSNGWYWSQALAACAVSWFESLCLRAPLLVFVLLWTMMAPAWNSVCLVVESDSLQNRFCSIFGGFWILPALIAWTILHSIYLWLGLLVFGAAAKNVGGHLHPGRFKSAFLLAPVIFVPAYGALILTVSLYWYSLFEHSQLRASPLGQIFDLRLLADVIRIPYALALVGVLWGAVLKSGRATVAWPDPSTNSSSANSETLTPALASDSLIVRRFFTLMVGAGLMNALIAGILLCRLPESHSPTAASLCTRAVLYVLAGALAGAGGTYVYWKNPASPFTSKAPLPFLLFALVCAAGWVWIPATVILSEELSPASALVAMIGAFVFTSGLRRVSSPVQGSLPHLAAEQGGGNLFAESLYSAPVEVYGYVVALSVYAGAAALCIRAYFAGTALFVLAASIFAWKKTIPQDQGFDHRQEYKRAALRLARIVIPALFVTLWALLDGVAHRELLAEAGSGSTPRAGNSLKKNPLQSRDHTATLGAGGYEGVILLPHQEKRWAIPPIAAKDVALVPGTKEPLVILFNGPYWYYQAPHTFPGSTAHKANGTPLGFEIRSNNFVPLVMNAHQNLSAAVPVERCREITVGIENFDNTAGEISLGVLLTDGAATKNSTVYLGEQPIVSSQSRDFALKRSPVFETLHFTIPTHTQMRNFNEITVLVLPRAEHALDAPRIAIQQFELYPR
jgi:hypothetical protein